MAKAKKSKLTIEDALVPIDEQPYEIPENWCWTFVNAVCIFENGYAFKSDKFGEEGTPVIRISNIQENEVDLDTCVYTSEEDIEERFVVKKGDLLIAMSGATTGKNGIYLSDERAYLNQRVGNIKVRNSEVLLPRFRDFYIMSKQEEILNSAYGGAQPNISSTKIGEMLFPLPPLAEQKRIVEQIENLFSKLDEAKEKAQGVVEQFELHKESILHQAFSGHLSKKWRIENGISADSWKQSTLGTYLNPMKTRKPEGETFRYIDIDAIDNKKQVIREAKETPVTEAPSRASRAVNSGDVLFSMVRPYLKNIAYVTEDMSDCIASTGFYVCSCKDGLYSKYLYELLRSKDAIDYLMQFMKGDNSPSIRKDDLLDMPLRLPCIDEQKEICQIVTSLLQKEEEAKEAAVKVIDQIDLMKKSILAKAFRGELGTNIADEESSIELLKEILN